MKMPTSFATDFEIYDLEDPLDKAKAAEFFAASKAGLRLWSLVVPKARCVVLEREYIDLDYRAGYARFHYIRHSDVSRRCERLHFFGTMVRPEEMAELSSEIADSYLGFTVVRPLSSRRLGRSILSKTVLESVTTDDKLFLTCSTTYSVNFAGTSLTVTGAPWMEQDRLVSACATVSLWVASWHLAHKLSPDFKSYYASEITDLATGLTLGRIGQAMPSEGLELDQMLIALKLMGYEPHCGYSSSASAMREFVYHYIESGLPVILTMLYPGRGGHTVTAVGHTMSTDPLGEPQTVAGAPGPILSSSRYAPEFIIQDDAGGPFRRIRFVDWETLHSWNKHDLSKFEKLSRSENCLAVIDEGEDEEELVVALQAVAPLPGGITLSGVEAAQLSSGLFEDAIAKDPGLALPGEGPIVMRSFVVRSNELKSAVASTNDYPLVLVRELRPHLLSRYVWVSEISREKDYLSSGRIHGHIVLDAAGSRPEETTALHIALVPDTVMNARPDGGRHWFYEPFAQFPRFEAG